VIPLAEGISAAWTWARIDRSGQQDAAGVPHDHPGDRAGVGHAHGVERRQRLVRRRRLRGDARGDAWLLLLGQADPEVEPGRLGNLRAEERAERVAGDAPQDLADEMPEDQRVVAVARARRSKAGLVVEHHPDGDPVLAALGELRPVPRHRRMQVDDAAGREDVRAQCGGTLGAGPDQHERVLVPRRLRIGVGDATPQVDDRLAVNRHADRGAHLAALGEVALELLPHGREPRRCRPLCRHPEPSCPRGETSYRFVS
jgi:hypothetical protein